MNQYKPYTKIQLKFIYKNRTLPHASLAAAFNKRFRAKKTAEQIHNLCNRKRWPTGRTGCYEKGHKPWNTGTKGLCKPNSGSFKKGNTPVNWKPVGSTRICSKDGYILVKFAEPNKWRAKQLLVWEAKHGKIAPGKVIRFKSNNKLNCRLSNLIEVSRCVHAYLNKNGYSKTPEKFKPTMMAIAKVKEKITALAKG